MREEPTNMQEDKNNIQNILDKIKNNEIEMTSRNIFVLKWVTLLITSVFFLLVGIYVFAYVIFLFVDNGLVYIPFFTQTGLVDFMIEIPWTLVLLGIFSVFLFSITSKTFYRIYKKPFLTFFFTIIIIIVLMHLIFLETGTMKFLKEEAFRENLQLVPDKFLQFRSSQTGSVFVGYVIGTTTNSLIIKDRQNNLLELIPQNSIDLNTFLIGNLVNAYGERLGQQIMIKSIVIVR